MKPRPFKIWTKGQRHDTTETVVATHKLWALLTYANRRGLKTIECDGKLAIRPQV
jgi:hypothetical protein